MLRSVALAAAATVCAAMGSTAWAADFSTSPAFSWSGGYVGAHAGYGSGTWDVDLSHTTGALFYNDPFVPPYGTLDGANGGLAGIQAGFNKQFGASVLGLEADASWTGITGKGRWTTIGPNYTTWDITSKLSAYGTVRGRLGLAEGNWLLYGTGGLAWGVTDTHQETNWFAPAPPDQGGRTSGLTNHLGYAVGAGIEWAFAPQWSIGAQYLYVDLGKQNYALNGTNKPPSDPTATAYTELFATSLAVQTVSIALNYHFGS